MSSNIKYFFSGMMRLSCMRFSLFSVALFLSACGSNDDRLKVDVSNVEVDVSFTRVDDDLLDIVRDTSHIPEFVENLRSEYPAFGEPYFQYILLLGNLHDPMVAANMRYFLADKVTAEALPAVQQVFADLSPFQKKLTEDFRHIKYYFPDALVPQVFFSYNAFNYGVFPTEKLLIIGLEMYMGANHSIIAQAPLYDFIKEKMIPEHLVIDAIRAWLEFYHLPDNKAEDFLGHLVFHGKLLYLSEAMMPDEPEHLIIRYTLDDLNWCIQHEEHIWKEVIDKKYLYSRDELNVTKFVNDGPFTAGLPQESPSRVGKWLGWMIVRDYMRQNPEVSLPELIQETDNQKILSFYRPGDNE